MINGIIGFLSAASLLSSIIAIRALSSERRKDEAIQEYSKTVTPLLRELLAMQKDYSSNTEKQDREIRQTMDRFADVIQRLVAILTTVTFIEDVQKKKQE